MSKTSRTITIRLLNEDRDRFLRLAEQNGMSNRELLVALMDLCEREYHKWDDTETSKR